MNGGNFVDNPFLIDNSGSSQSGKRYIIQEYDIESLSVEKCPIINKYFDFFMKKNTPPCASGNTHNIEFICSDPFTHRILINLYMQTKIFSCVNSHVSVLETAYVCSNRGYYVFEYLGSSKLESIIKEHGGGEDSNKRTQFIKSIWIQLLALLKTLSSYDFVHGNPSMDSIFFIPAPISYVYDDHIVKSDVTLKLCNLKQSSLTIKENKSRLVCHDSVIENQLSSQSTFPELFSLYNNNNNKNFDRKSTYQFNLHTYRLISDLRKIGIPILGSSLDVYLFTLSLMLVHSFQHEVLQNKNLLSIWKSMWDPDQYDDVMNLVRKFTFDVSSDAPSSDAPKSDFLASILIRKTLQCSILESLWEQFKN
jgi:hypothetical protein